MSVLSKKEKFFFVWNGNFCKMPQMKHSTFESAKSEAERLAELNAGVEFVVLESIGYAVTKRVYFFMHESTNDEIPF